MSLEADLRSGDTIGEAARKNRVTRERARQVAKQLVDAREIARPKDYKPRALETIMTTTAPARAAIEALEPGFYVLTQDVTNPKPDRRYKNYLLGREVVKAGLRVQVTQHPIDETRYRKELRAFGGETIPNEAQMCPLAEAIAPHLAPAEPHLGQLINSNHPANGILAVLLEQGKITLDDVKGTFVALEQKGDDPNDEGSWETWQRQHWIDREAW